MFGNGAGIGLEITVLLHRPILTVLRGAIAGWGGAVAGSQVLTTAVRPIATAAARRIGETYLVFAL